MLVLSVRQPWAWAIVTPGVGKDIENRDWPTKIRGRVAIHASKGCTLGEYEDAADFIYTIDRTLWSWIPPFKKSDRGVIVGTVEIVDCVTSSASPWFVGDFGFVLRDPRPLATPIPWKGSLGFRELPEDIARLLRGAPVEPARGTLLDAMVANGGTLPTVGPVPSVADIIAERWDEDSDSPATGGAPVGPLSVPTDPTLVST